ncbi:MAG: FkbM family methyltransferase [Gammaproteobacteria bacterium]
MKHPLRRALTRASYALLPPALMKHRIGLRNWLHGEAEIRLLDVLVDPRRAAADVGAHLGAYTYFLVGRAARVHAFEPQPWCARFLARAYGRAVTVHACALSDHDGSGTLDMVDQGYQAFAAALDRRGPQAPDRRRVRIDVPVRTLDGFGFDDLGFVKIDADGGELPILRGARATLARCRPVLLVEIEQRNLSVPMQQVFDEIAAAGYRGEFLERGVRRPLADFSLQAHQLARLAGDRSRPYINNFIFLPD